MKTTLETSEDENHTRNEWIWKLYSKRVKMRTTLESSEDEKTTLETSEELPREKLLDVECLLPLLSS